MNILVVCNYRTYSFPFSYIRAQVKEYVLLGNHVRVILTTPVGAKGRGGRRLGADSDMRCEDGAELFDLRYLSFSSFGRKKLNAVTAVASSKRRCLRVLQDFSPDVIHAHTLGQPCVIGRWIKEQMNCPMVVTTHGSDAIVPFRRGDYQWLRDRCEMADAVVTVGTALKGELIQCGVKKEPLTIMNGYAPPEGGALAGSEKLFQLIQVGSLIPQKKVDTTIQAFARLHKAHPSMHLVVIGDGPEREKLETLCRSLCVADCVSFLGQLQNPQVLDHLCRSRFFAMPSVNEGFGIVYLEAMSAGCVTIGTRGEGIADLIRSGENGFLVPPDDPDAIVDVIETCIAKPELADQIAARAKLDVKNLTWRENAEKYLALFAQLIGDCK